MTDQPTIATELKKAVETTLSDIGRERERDVIERRFGLNGQKETLETVGEMLGITRERVRQIEKATLIRMRINLDDGKNPAFDVAEMEIVKTLHEMGRAARTDLLAQEIFGENSSELAKNRAILTLLAELSQKMVVVSENDKYYPAIALSEAKDDREIKREVDLVFDLINKNKKPVSEDEMFKLLSQEKTAKKYEHPREVTALASLSKKITVLDEMWGSTKWPSVNPRNIRDKIYVVLRQEGKPLHFSEIAKKVKSDRFSHNKVTDQAVHNELIKDARFVLVGRGIYALGEWGYEKGSIADVISAILAKEQPLDREEIVRRVLKKRQVREATILLNLQNKTKFEKIDRTRYQLKK